MGRCEGIRDASKQKYAPPRQTSLKGYFEAGKQTCLIARRRHQLGNAVILILLQSTSTVPLALLSLWDILHLQARQSVKVMHDMGISGVNSKIGPKIKIWH